MTFRDRYDTDPAFRETVLQACAEMCGYTVLKNGLVWSEKDKRTIGVIESSRCHVQRELLGLSRFVFDPLTSADDREALEAGLGHKYLLRLDWLGQHTETLEVTIIYGTKIITARTKAPNAKAYALMDVVWRLKEERNA